MSTPISYLAAHRLSLAWKAFVLFVAYGSLTYGQERSHTFLTLMPPFMSGSPERESLVRMPFNGNLSFIQIVPLGGHSLGSQDIAEYFLPSGKSTLLVAEDLAPGSAMRDLAASHFNIKTKEGTFKSDLTFHASHQFAGFGLAYRQQFAERWWLELGTPFLRVEQTFRFKERIRDTGGGPVRELGLDNSPRVGCMTAAFKQPNWRFGKINKRLKLVKEGFADLELKCGYQARADERVRLYGYAGFIFPTGNKPSSTFVFEPIIGNNKHYGVLYGSHVGLAAWCCGEHVLSLAIDLQARYLFSNHQIRSFDLKDKEFSRYIESYRNPEQAQQAFVEKDPNSGTSGINIYTKRVKVIPGLSLSFLSAFLYNYKCLEVEAGSYFFARQAENIEINWNGLADIKNVTGKGETNRARTMSEDFPGSAIPFQGSTHDKRVTGYQPLVGRNIDSASPATPAVLYYTAYLSIGCYVLDGDYPTLIGIGASYQAPATRGLSQWMSWGKVAVQF